MFSSTIVALLALAMSVNAHMEINYPPPLRSKFNTNAKNPDFSMTSPLDASGDNFPCKGYQADMADTTGAGASVVTWDAGSTYNFSWVGGATHGGGSCQVALSYDQGKSFKVIHSYIGSCPLTSGQTFDFAIPSDATAGSALVGFTWYNVIGNREIYMNCASVTIAGASSKARAAPAVAFSARPDLFVANLGNGCTSVEGKEIVFPNPGPSADVTTKQAISDDSGSFTGTCAAVKGIGGESGSSTSGSGSSGSTGESSAAPAASVASSPASSAPAAKPTSSIVSIQIIPSPNATTAPTGFATSAATSAASAPGTSVSAASPSSTASVSTGSVKPSQDGLCGGSQTCAGSTWGHCCSSAGFCGIGDAWCGTGCQAAFGQCGTFTNNTSAVAARRSRVFRG